MKRISILTAFLTVFFACLLFPVKAHAASVSYTYLDGSAITATDDKDGSGHVTFTNANAEITGAGYTVIAYIYNDCRQATTTTDLSGVSSLIAVTSKNVTKHGTLGTNGIWFIYNNTLYITGNGVINDNSTYNASNFNTITDLGTGFTVKKPSITYGDIINKGYGIHLPEEGDEKKLTDKYYNYTDMAGSYLNMPISERAPYTITDLPFGKMAAGTLTPNTVGWIGSAGSIETIYVSDDLKLAGNLALLFNANSGTYLRLDYIRESVYTRLRNVYLYADLSDAVSTAGMFARCPALEHIYLRNGTAADLNKCVNTSFMFYGDSRLSNGENSLIDNMELTSGTLTTTQYMFGGCSSINKPCVKNYDMSNVLIADGMFYGAVNANLTASGTGSAYDVSTWNMPVLKSAAFMFAGNMPQKDGKNDLDNPETGIDPGLGPITAANTITGSVNMSGWNLASLETAYFMFAQNTGLTGVTMGAGSNSLKDTSGMFLRCDNLSSVNFNNTSMPSLLYTTAMFRGAGSSAQGGTASFSHFNCPALVNADHMFHMAGYSTINFDSSSDFSNLEEAIAMFADNPKLTSLGNSGLSHARFSKLTNSSYMFSGDSGLTVVNSGNWDMSRVTDISHMFADCAALANADFSAWRISNALKDMECFAYNTSLPIVNISSWDTSGVTNMFMAFAKNTKLRNVTMPQANSALNSLTNANGLFYGDSALTAVSQMPVANNLVDARGMFADCPVLSSVAVKSLINTAAKYTAFMFQRDTALASIDITDWKTSGMQYAEGIFDGCNKLTAINTGSGFSGTNLINMGTAFRNCHVLSESSLKTLITKLTGTTALKDMYETFKNCYAITELDLTPMNLGTVTDFVHLAYMEESSGYETNLLDTIKVPANLLSAPGVILSDSSDGSGTCINMFWVDGDGSADGTMEEGTSTDDLLTHFFVNGALNANLAAYQFGGTGGDNDNRRFIIFDGRSINGKDIGTYSLKSDKDSAALKITAHTTFYTGGTTSQNATPLPAEYSWTKDSKGISGAKENTYKANAKGTYAGIAKVAKLTGTDSNVSATFMIGSKPVSINAVYKGGKIPVGGSYTKSDVEVEVIDEDGKAVKLSPDDFSVNSLLVTKAGDNKYTVIYKPSDGVELKSTITVPGIRVIGSIKAKYTGPQILVGEEYDTGQVVVTAYYADDKSKKEGFEVKGSAFSGTKVTKIGANSYTVTYNDPEQDNKAFSAKYNVPGYQKVKSMTATYNGPKIKVGNQYKQEDVTVTLQYEGGTSGTTKDFTVDSKTVQGEGDNSFKATYNDPAGGTLTASFTVPGYKESSSSSSSWPYAAMSSLYGAPGGSFAGTQLYPGVASGIVQTGTTGKTILYIIAAIALILVIIAAVVLKGGNKDKDKKKR